MYVQVTSSIYGDVATFTAFRRVTWATVIAIGVLTNINESSQQYDIVNKEKINSSFFHVFSKIFIKKVNLNNKYLKIIKHLLDKIEGVLDAKSIFRLKRSSHSQFFYEIATLTIPTESSGKCATWSLFSRRIYMDAVLQERLFRRTIVPVCIITKEYVFILKTKLLFMRCKFVSP